MGSDSAISKPRLLFFRRTRPGLAPFLAQHLDAQTRTLGYFFDVQVIAGDCDYGMACDKFEPALSVFESGVYSGRRRITNTGSRPAIPKLGFLHSDAYDISRASFLSDMERWDVSNFFTTSVVMAEYTPEIASRLFVWPNAIDPAVFHDYGIDKNIDVLFTGSLERHYPWRNRMHRIVSTRYPTMVTPHLGWGRGTDTMIVGEAYARLLNASRFVPACGSMAGEVVRKQLEIPASMACLVTERTDALEAFGFKDMENCVFANSTDVLDKLEHLDKNIDALYDITRAGFDLVHSRHTEAHRNQVLEWLRLQASVQPGQGIVQRNPSGTLSLESAASGVNHSPRCHIRPMGNDRGILEHGWGLLRSGNPEHAEQEFLRCLNYYFIPDAITGRVFASLLLGNTEPARQIIGEALRDLLLERAAEDPDPVLWACWLRTLLCAGDHDLVVKEAQRFPNLSHPELDRVRLIVSLILPNSQTGHQLSGKNRPSVMAPPALPLRDWVQEFAVMAERCGNAKAAQALAETSTRPLTSRVPEQRRTKPSRLGRMRNRIKSAAAVKLRTGRIQKVRLALSPLKRRLFSDDWSDVVALTIRGEEMQLVLIIGVPDRRQTAAVELGVRMNPLLPSLLRIESWDQEAVFSAVPSSATEVLLVLNFRREDAAAVGEEIWQLLSLGAIVSVGIVIYGTTTPAGYELFSRLVDSDLHILLAHISDGVSGRAVFRRAPSPRTAALIRGTA